MFNLAIGSMHPSVICVELSKFTDSLNSLKEVLGSPYPEEELTEFIETYARTDEILPSDKTVGFVIASSTKKIVSFSFSKLSEDLKKELDASSQSFEKIGYSVEIDTQ
ncbi:MAG: TA0956 family protein [Thermoplasmatales archaeon]|nr:TA0956 family protein [Thermoplasmatales archaeon]